MTVEYMLPQYPHRKCNNMCITLFLHEDWLSSLVRDKLGICPCVADDALCSGCFRMEDGDWLCLIVL